MKGKRIWSGLLALVFCLGLLPATALAADDTDITTEGSWTDQNNYDISWYTTAASDTTEFTLSDAADLAGLAVIVNGLYKVTGDEDWHQGEATLGGKFEQDEELQDSFEEKTIKLADSAEINLSNKNWTPIGSSNVSPFKGTFDGSNATITGLTITDGSRNAGLFGHVDGGTIQDVTLTDVNVSMDDNDSGYIAVGGVAACIYGTSSQAVISNCSVSGTIELNSGSWKFVHAVGGIVGATGYSVNGGTIGQHDEGKSTVENCAFTGTIQSSGTETGGIVGRSGGAVKKCTNEGAITTSADGPVGGIVGLITCNDPTTFSIEDCDNQGKITNSGTTIEAAAGGIAGEIGMDCSAVYIKKCRNSGEIVSAMTAGGILGRMNCTQSSDLDTVEISQCYNAGKIQAKKEFESTTTGAGGLIGVLAYGAEEQVTVKDCYNVGIISGGTNNNTGGLLGATLTNTNGKAGTISLISCYNAGKLTGHSSYTGGILGRDGAGSSAKLTHCYFWEDCGSMSGPGTSATANYMTEDNSTWADNLGLDTTIWKKDNNNLSDPQTLIGYLPVLKENKQDPAPTLTRSAKQDQGPLTISGLPSGTINETCAEFTLTAADSTGDGAVTWKSSDTNVATVDDSGKVTITGVGPVTITATKAGGNDYNDATASVSFTVYGQPISEVTILNLAAPVQGASPVQHISVPDDANYAALTGLGVGGEVLDVTWKDGDGHSVSTFEKDKVYTATIRLKANEYYSFADSVDVELASIRPTAIQYSSATAAEDGTGNLIVEVVFNATTHEHLWSEKWTDNATHHWHACQNDGCPLSESGMQDYNQHVDTDDDGTCDTCNATIGYLITFDAGGGTCDQNDARTDVNGKLFSLPTPTRGNYTFDGWFTMATGGEKVTTDTVFTQDTTIYAHWTAVSSGGSSRPTYPPIVTDTAGGDTSVAPARPHKGDTVTITPKPDQGNEVDSVTVTDRNGDPVKVTDKGDGTYTFTQPTGKVTISVTFRDKETPGLPFVDVAPDTWYFDAVRYAYENSLMVGTSPTAFSPNGMTTRAQIVTILWRLVDSPAGEAPVDFADVDPAAWYGEAVRWAAGQGIVGGYGNGSFGPNDPVTREQLAAILYRFAQHMGYDTEGQADLSGFTDLAQVSTYAREAMAWCVDAGLLSGTSPTTLSPRGQATRAQTAAVLMRLCQGYGM